MKKNPTAKTEDSSIALLKKLIKFESIEGNLEEKNNCLKEIEKRFKKYFNIKWYSFQDRPILVLSNTKSREVDVILAGHVDVVPASDKGYIPKEKQGRIYGRGSIDMKGPMAACLSAAADYVKSSEKIKVAVIITTDEEIDGLSTKWLAKEIGYKAKIAILPDGGKEDEIVLKQKGFLQLKVTLNGKSAHASRYWEGRNPIEMGIDLGTYLKNKFPQPKDENQWKTSIALTKFEAGKSLNQIPSKATLFFDIRYTQESIKKKIIEKINLFCGKNCDVKVVAQNGILLVDKNNKYVQQIRKTIEEKTNKKINFLSECGTSDAIFLAKNGTPTILFQPTGGGAHQEDEWVDKKSLLTFRDIIFDFLKNFS